MPAAYQKWRLSQFSLRTLIVVVTCLCLLLGRVDYLRRRREFHRREAERHLRILCERTGLSEDDVGGLVFQASEKGCGIWLGPPERRFYYYAVADDDTRAVNYHYEVGERYDRAGYWPWTFVDEKAP